VGDWPDWRGPDRDGISREKGLPEKWSLDGQGLAWKAPYGGRSTPVVLGDHLYLENTAGARETEQERLMCFNADTGKLLWEYKFSLYQSDVPAHRVGWASPVADPETGNVYSFGVNNLVTALTKDGQKLWERSITEEFSPFTTHGGRTVSPAIDGNLVIVSTPTSTWGTQANRTQRFIAMNKRTGEIVWISTPGGRPYDTSYGPMNFATVDGTRLLLAGGSDGSVMAMKPQTGEPVFNLVIAKRGLNTGIVVNGKYAIASHGDENLDSNEMGMIVRISTPRAKASSARMPSSGRCPDSWAASRRRSSMATASIRPTIMGTFLPSMSKRATSFGSRPGHRAEGVDGVRRWQDLHRQRERQVLHPAPARGPVRSVERGRAAA
jgi:outer membrane protein assembly factor BamB